MPVTYSVNVGQNTEALRKASVYDVLLDLPNNTQKQISPKDVRDAFLSAWANSSLRVTTPGVNSTQEYIGIDSGNPSARDIKNKIFIGKRQYGNLDIMNSTLLNSDTDIFFYNTKSDSASQSSTKISILASTNSLLYPSAPYIESKLNSGGTGFDFNLINPSIYDGPINIFSLSGRVSINNVVFPTVAETAASASSGKILRYSGTYPNGYLQWDLPSVSLTSIGVTGLPTNIYGSTVSVNGYPIEFIEDSVVPFDVGGVTQGTSFPINSFYNGIGYQNWPVVEVLREILYPYITPILTLSCDVNSTGMTFAEVGTTPSLTITYSVTHFARENSETISAFLITSSSSLVQGTTFSGTPVMGFTGPPGSYFTGTATLATFSNVTNAVRYFYSYASNDGTTSPLGFPLGFSFSATASMQFVSPIVAAFVPSTVLNPSVLSNGTITLNALTAMVYGQTVSVNKLIVPYPGMSQSVKIAATGSGYLYFCVPTNTGWGNTSSISMIKDPNGFIVHDQDAYTFSAFTYSPSPLNTLGPFNYYSTYRLYKSKLPCSYYGDGLFELTFSKIVNVGFPPAPTPTPAPMPSPSM